MTYLYIKALHIIFVVTWFSGMFYLVRLFIYNCESNDKPDPEKSILQKQFGVMISRLYWAITFPSAILSLIFGTILLHYFWPFPTWLWLKLFFVLLLFVYQYSLHIIYKQQNVGIFKYKSHHLRIWNEVPTIILVAVVMLVVVKQGISLVYGLIGLIAFIIIIMTAIKIYKNIRNSDNSLKAL